MANKLTFQVLGNGRRGKAARWALLFSDGNIISGMSTKREATLRGRRYVEKKCRERIDARSAL